MSRTSPIPASKSTITDSVENETLPSIKVRKMQDNVKKNKSNPFPIDTNRKTMSEKPDKREENNVTVWKNTTSAVVGESSDMILSSSFKTHSNRFRLGKFHSISNYSKISRDMSNPNLQKPKPLLTNKMKRITGFHSTLESSEEVINNYVYEEEHNIIYLPRLQSIETIFLQLVTSDKVEPVSKYLEEHPKVNINCTDFQGVSALHIAVQNKSEAMVEFLLRHPNIEIGDTVLHAVRCNSIKILVMLLEARKKISPGLEFAGAAHSTYFPSYITPLMLAAQLGQYELVTLLIARGHTITRPHLPNCPCMACRKSLVNEDPLHASGARFAVYRAISSPAYIVHVSSDPVLTSFQLADELAANAAAYRQLSEEYLQLRQDVNAFAVDLIGCCRNSEEVEVILKQTSGCRSRRHMVLPRLLMAVDYRQKEFVAHPHTQQVLESYWVGDWYSWRRKSSLSKASTVLSRIIIIPFILLMCTIAPRHSLVRHWQIPLNKLITHAAAYFVFLVLIFYISNQDKSTQKRGPPNTGAEALLVLYVCGYSWSAVRMCVIQGPRRYFTVMWNWAEITMLALFALTFAFWIAAAVDVATNDKEDLERKYWNQYDPTLLAEGTFCLATIFAYFRMMFLCQLNYHLGPLQVSLGKMTIDIYKYIIVFAIIISSFAAGLARLYQYYNGMVYEDEFGMKTVQVSSFTSLGDTLNTLFWALFCMAPLESADVVLENTRDPKTIDKTHENRHGYTERIGYFCFGCFEVISVIVVLNMLIATMSNTFQRVNDNVAIEWTFCRTEVYIDYIAQTTLPSPFNMIPTASGMSSVIEWIRIKFSKPVGMYARWSPLHCCYIERDVESNVLRDFPALMSVIVQRYFRHKSKCIEPCFCCQSRIACQPKRTSS